MVRNIEMVRGDTLSFGIEFEGLDQDLDAAYFTVRNRNNDGQILQKSIGDGITKTEANKYRVRVAPEDTANVTPGVYNYDLEITVGDDVYTILRGTLQLFRDETRRS